MKAISREQKRRTTEWLDERWQIINMTHYVPTPADESYYKGALKAIEMLGFDWERDSEGHHKIF